MKFHLRLLTSLLSDIHADLSRPHAFAAERVGFLTCGAAQIESENLLLLGETWHVIDDENYVDDPTAGATIGGRAFRNVLQLAFREPTCILHVHRHDHRGRPRFSRTDERSMCEFVPGFFNSCRTRPHGALVLSEDSGAGAIWLGAELGPQVLNRIEIVGVPLRRWRGS